MVGQLDAEALTSPCSLLSVSKDRTPILRDLEGSSGSQSFDSGASSQYCFFIEIQSEPRGSISGFKIDLPLQ